MNLARQQVLDRQVSEHAQTNDSSDGQGSIRLAILGTRGIPARYGGFETFAQELGTRLVKRGHKVTVYGRHRFFSAKSAVQPGSYLGVSLRSTPTIMHKYLETPVHALTSFLDTIGKEYDLILLCNAANSPFSWIGRLAGFPVLINVDGIERKRAKWNAFGRLWYRLGEFCSVLFGSRVIADAEVIAEYYQGRFGCQPAVIAYGGEAKRREPGEVLDKFGLKSREFILYVSRLEPENNALGVIRAYRRVATQMPLVIVGDAPYSREYIAQLKREADSRVVFTGYQFEDAYHELQSHAAIYIQATEVGGTHPALVEAMAYGNCIVANGTPENIEVLGNAGMFYPKNDFEQLSKILEELIQSPSSIRELRHRAMKRCAEHYSWEVIVDQYEKLLLRHLPVIARRKASQS